MRRRFRSSFAIAFFSLAVVLRAQDISIVVGERVGPVRKDSTRQSLAERVGPGEITDGTIEVGEGVSQPATFLFKSDPARTLAILFGEDGHPASVAICPDRQMAIDGKLDCEWRTAEGVRLGMSLERLVELNQGEITFLGFGWDYDGVVTSWNGGKLQNYKNCAGLYVRLGTKAEPLPKGVSGDQPISSKTPALRSLNVRVSELKLSFEDAHCEGRQ